MDVIRWSISKPVSVTVGVILLVMFGLIGLSSIPVQLTPTVDRPVIEVTTAWPGRSPQEIVDNITREQEKRLKNVSNLKQMRSTSEAGAATVSLEFYVGSDISRALQEVSDALRQVPAYPEEVDEPTIKAADGSGENAIAWIIVDVDPAFAHLHPGYDITTLFDALDKEVKPFLERIDGVAEVNVYGGREREVRVLVDAGKLAQRRLNHLDLIGALRAENQNVSAGTIAEGKRDYRVRVLGQFVTEQDVLDTIIAYRPADDGERAALKPVYVRDVAEVEFGYQKQRGFVRSMGYPSIAINAIRQSNANVVSVMEDLRARLADVRRDILPRLAGDVGPHLRMRQVYDETTYIDSAISLVVDALWQGGALAAIVLLIFLRSLRSTGLVAVAIPLSVIGAFLVMFLAGRTLNVVSLAGLAFSVGMGIDNAIVVLENIYRRRQMGDPPVQAAYRGTREVWGAILASTLTNVAVFVPIITVQEEAGQLFRDITIAACASVFFSLVVAITVLPAAAARWISDADITHKHRSKLMTAWDELFGLARLAVAGSEGIANSVYWAITGWRAHTVRPAVILVLTGASLTGAYLLMPPLDYLPTGNRNLVFGGLLIPPGYSVGQQEEIAQRIEDQLRPYIEADLKRPETLANLEPIFRYDAPTTPYAPVPIANFFIGSFGGGMFVGAVSQDEERVIPIGSLLTGIMNTIPDAFGGAAQTPIFGQGIRQGNTVDVEIAGPDLARVVAAAAQLQGVAGAKYGYGMNVAPSPSNFNLSQPEWSVRLNQRGRELGLTSRDIGTAVRGLFDGAYVDDFQLPEDTVDLVLVPKGGRLDYKEQLASIPIATPSTGPSGARVVPLDTVVDVIEVRSPQAIQRAEELPSVTIKIRPPTGTTVDEVMRAVRGEMIAPMEASGMIDASMRVRLEGTAASLDEVRGALFGKAREGPRTVWQKWLERGTYALCAAGFGVALLLAIRGAARTRQGTGTGIRIGRGTVAYGAVGIVLLTLMLGAIALGLVSQPQLVMARIVWALLVTYLLMCALYESFLYPLVIMFSVPLAVVGGFAGLALVHYLTLQNPTKAPQQLDVLTMLGFVILTGIVVNNAILLVEQALNLMEPWRLGEMAAGEKPLPAMEAIAESVRTRIRPIFMSTLTSVVGSLPLVLYPGSGSEMYRGMGAVLIGGQLVSTVFTLVLVPLVFSLVVQMRDSGRALLNWNDKVRVWEAGTQGR